jgi:hypothetical protein
MKRASKALLIITIINFVAAIITGIVAGSMRNDVFTRDTAKLQAAADLAATSTLLMTWGGVGVIGLLVVSAINQQIKVRP